MTTTGVDDPAESSEQTSAPVLRFRNAAPWRLPTASEQHLLNHLRVRPVTEAERPRWNAEVAAHHYLQNATLLGEQLCYVAEYQGTWLALLGWSAPARHSPPLRRRWAVASIGSAAWVRRTAAPGSNAGASRATSRPHNWAWQERRS